MLAQQITKGEYFYDTDPGIGNGTLMNVIPGDSVLFAGSIPTTGLSVGFHTLFTRFRDANGKWGLYEGRTIYVKDAAIAAVAPQLKSVEAFFDTDPGLGNGIQIAVTPGDSVVANLSVPTPSTLASGFHNLFIRFRDQSNEWGLYEGRLVFIAEPIQASPTLVSAEAFFDTDPGIGNGFAINFPDADSLTYTASIPTAGLTQGVHNLFTRVKDADGIWSLYESREIVVCNQGPSAGYSFATSGNQVTFTNTSATEAYSFSWDFGDGTFSSEASPVHNYTSAGVFNVCLIATSGCGADTVCQTVSFNCSTPLANYSSSVNSLNVNFTNTSSGGTSYLWNFGDGTTSTLASPSHTFSNTGAYNVCLVTINACGTNQKCSTVNVTCAVPTALYTRTITGQTVTFSNSSSNAASVIWYFGDGQTSTQYNTSHQYTSAGSYNVKLKVINGCGADSLTYLIDVNCSRPDPAFNYYSDGLTAEFENTSLNGTSYSWNFNDGTFSSLKNPTHNFPSAGTFSVCLIVTNSCGADTLCQSVNVCTAPTANFTFAPSGTSVNFTNTSLNASSYYWTFGNSYATNQVSPAYTYPNSGTFNVCLVVNNSCGADTICKAVETFCAAIMNQEICLSTVDTLSTHNIIYWEKLAVTGIDSFRIYREVTTNTYAHIASVHYDSLSEYHDTGADPNVTSYKYKMTVIDTCGNESVPADWSLYHNTIHLQNLGNGNLQWTLYEIEGTSNPVTFYRVYRDDLGTGNFLPISSTIPGGNTTYTDVNYALYPLSRYRVDVAWSISCSPTRASVNTTRSNIKNGSSTTTGIQDKSLNDHLLVYPNPASENITVEFLGGRSNELSVYNSFGQVVYSELIINNEVVMKKTFDISNLQKGIYYIRLTCESKTFFERIAIQ
jgi:PKD repeat protein